MKRFEYIIRINCELEDLNKYGAEGWELMDIVDTKIARRFYFKRITTEEQTYKSEQDENIIQTIS